MVVGWGAAINCKNNVFRYPNLHELQQRLVFPFFIYVAAAEKSSNHLNLAINNDGNQ